MDLTKAATAFSAYIEEITPVWCDFLLSLGYYPNSMPDRLAYAYFTYGIHGEIWKDDWGPMTRERLSDLLILYVDKEADRRVFVAICDQMQSEWKWVRRKIYEELEAHED